jgi:hypothetical protein
MKVITEQRTHDWVAYLEGHLQYWDCGLTETDAILNLIKTLRTYQNLTITVGFNP